MKNEKKPNWLVPKIYERAREQEEDLSWKQKKTTSLDDNPVRPRQSLEQVSDAGPVCASLYVLPSRNSDYPDSHNRVSVQLRIVSLPSEN